MEDPDNGDNDDGAPPPPSLVEPIDVLNYIKRLIPVLMEEDPMEITPQFEVNAITLRGDLEGVSGLKTLKM